MAKAKKSTEVVEMTIAEKLKALYDLQLVDTSIDKIRILRGELPLEVEDLEDEIEGLQTRVSKHDEDVEGLDKSINGKKQELRGSKTIGGEDCYEIYVLYATGTQEAIWHFSTMKKVTSYMSELFGNATKLSTHLAK